MLLIILNQVDKLDELLDDFMENKISGATILNSTGMMRELAKRMEDYPILGSLRYLIDLDRSESKTIFMVLPDDDIKRAQDTVRSVIGDLSQPDTAVMFTLPVLSAEGSGFNLCK